MPIDTTKLYVFRMTEHTNIESILLNGMYSRSSEDADRNYKNIGNSDVIERRNQMKVKCYPGTYVNDYVPFYFGVRTPMLYNIITGHTVERISQDKIVYLVCKFEELTASDLQWCFTDGNAATVITTFFNSVENINNLDWKSIHSTDWRLKNSDGDRDRPRKKHSEFLIKDHVPVEFIKAIIVLTEQRKVEIETLIKKHNLKIQVIVDKANKYYF